MTNATVIETMLLRWSDNHNGRTVTFLLPSDPGDHPFRGLKCGPANGQRMALSIALIADDETTNSGVATPPREAGRAQAIGNGPCDPASPRFSGAEPVNPATVSASTAATQKGESRTDHRDGSPQADGSPPGASKWDSMSPAAQAGFLCTQEKFQRFLYEHSHTTIMNSDEAASAVRVICGVKSRKDILPHTKAAHLWGALVADYRNWQWGRV